MSGKDAIHINSHWFTEDSKWFFFKYTKDQVSQLFFQEKRNLVLTTVVLKSYSVYLQKQNGVKVAQSSLNGPAQKYVIYKNNSTIIKLLKSIILVRSYAIHMHI